jgi:hypothetical protein
MHRRITVLLATMAIAAILATGIASADPLNSKNAQVFPFDCGGEVVSVVTIINSQGSVGNVVGSTSNFVTTRGEGTLAYTDPGSGQKVVEPFVLTVGQGNRTGQEGKLTTCNTTFTDQDPLLGPVTYDVEITGFFTPMSAIQHFS